MEALPVFLADVSALGGPVGVLACGTGRELEAVGKCGCAPLCIDTSEEMLQWARRSNGACGGFVRADAEQLPLRDEALPGAVTLRFLPHLPPVGRARVLKECARVVRDFLIISDNHSRCVQHVWHRFLQLLVPGKRGKPSQRGRSLRALREELAEAGFDLTAVAYVSRRWQMGCTILARKRRPE